MFHICQGSCFCASQVGWLVATLLVLGGFNDDVMDFDKEGVCCLFYLQYYSICQLTGGGGAAEGESALLFWRGGDNFFSGLGFLGN